MGNDASSIRWWMDPAQLDLLKALPPDKLIQIILLLSDYHKDCAEKGVKLSEEIDNIILSESVE